MKKIIKSKEVDGIFETEQGRKRSQQKADEILARAEIIFKKAYGKGLAQGKEDAKLKAMKQSADLVSDSIDYIQQLKGDIVDIVLNNIRKIIADYESNELLIKSIKQSLSELSNTRKITLRISPSIPHETLLRIRDIEILSGVVNVIADHRVGIEDCIIESEMGVVHVNVKQKIEELEKLFRTKLDLEQTNPIGDSI